MNDAVIIAVANAITANAEVLKSLIDSLPKATVEAVEKKVTKATTKQEQKTIIETQTPVVVEAPAAPVVETTTVSVAVPTTSVGNAMPAAPFPNASVFAPTPVAPVPAPVVMQNVSPVPSTPSPTAGAGGVVVPFSDAKQMLKYVMDSYQAMGPEKGKNIQGVLNSIGVHNINDVKPEQYGALYAGVEALKNG